MEEKEEKYKLYGKLRDLDVNYGKDNLAQKYREIARTTNINQIINYGYSDIEVRKEYNKEGSTFHFVLNIMVSERSEFVPFVFGVGESNGRRMNDVAREILVKDSIKYSFSDFFTDVSKSESCKGLCNQLPRLSFHTQINDKNELSIDSGRVFVSKDGEHLWYEPNTTDKEIDVSRLLCKRGDNKWSFMEEISNTYSKDLGITDLYVTIISLDPSFQSGKGLLSQFMIISPNQDEATFFIKESLDKIREIISRIRTRYVYDLLEKNRYEAIKSAKAAIMSRNISHNLGSHVMAYLKQHLGSVRDMLKDRILSQLFDNEGELDEFLARPADFSTELKNKIGEDANINSIALPFLVGLGQFVSYLQERQDFIATIATDYIPYYSTVNFKDFIYDELNNDKRYQRHPDRQNLKPDNILLGNIARSEGLGRTTCPTDSNGDSSTLHDIVLKFRTTFNGDPVEEINNPRVNPLDYYGDEDLVKRAKAELEEMRGYDVSLPGGIVGRQAFFSIIENIIRNAAKHGNWRDKGKLELTIDIFAEEDILDTDPNECLKNRLRDDRWAKKALSLKEVLEKYYCRAEGECSVCLREENLYFVTITDNLSLPLKGAVLEEGITPDALSSLRKAIIEDYVDSSNQMKNSNKGIKEMRISSAWLRSIDDDKRYFIYDENNYNKEDSQWGKSKIGVPPVLYVRLSKDAEGDCHLQYIFCLVRPQKVAFVSSEFSSIEGNLSGLLRKKAWRTFTPEAYIGCGNRSFDIVVYDDTKEEEFNALPKDEQERRREELTRLIDDRNQVRCISSSRFVCISELENSIKETIKDVRNKIVSNDNSVNELLDNAECRLYQHLSKWNTKEKILIVDEKAKSNIDRLSDTEKSVIYGKITFDQNDGSAKYRYLTHLEDKEEFEKHIIGNESANQYVASEGITGNNSTDRLIRNEKLTEIWFYKHLRALKQKVAIFDERIFSKTFGLEESDLSEEFYKHNDILFLEKMPDDVKEGYFNQYNMQYQPYYDKENVDAKNYIGATYASKGLYIFTIVRSVSITDKTFNLYGYRSKTECDAYSECVKCATLSWDDKDKKLNIDPCGNTEENLLHGYDVLSVHQGLLDKLYGLFEIKDDIQARENLAKDFYSFFADKDNVIGYQDKGKKKTEEDQPIARYFLPGMTIHSGRSKPSEDDMPQHLPFIPYSAIEHAVFDCKYSLIELLDSARYE